MKEMTQRRRKRIAVVQCAGRCRTKHGVTREELHGNCGRIAEEYPEGIPECRWGCLGGGSCAEVCQMGAVRISQYGTAEIDQSRCVGCGLCVKVCPRHLIRLTFPEYNIYPACVNEEPGAQTRKKCDTGCIACGICEKNCPVNAIKIEENHAVIDEEKCIACGMCAVKCPRGTIRDFNGIFTVREEQV